MELWDKIKNSCKNLKRYLKGDLGKIETEIVELSENKKKL